MIKVCHICGKGTMSGNKVSHSHRRTRRIWKPNVQKVRVLINGSPKNVHVCAKCLKAGNVVLA